jgi:hypothetical protein
MENHHMRQHPIITVALAIVFICSAVLLATSVVSINEANKRLGKILDVTPEQINLASRDPAPSIDDQILSVQGKLRTASNGIRTKKAQINFHATQAVRAIDSPGEQSLRDAKSLLKDILENSKIVLQRNEEIEAETLRLYSLYQRKIEILLSAKQAQKESSFGMTFWAGLIGLLTTISGMLIAWRQDNLSHKKDHREFLKLRQELASAQST